MIRNDITRVVAEAIVNPANLLQGSGTSHAIYQAAGEQELTAACEAIGYCELGGAVCTPALGLSAKYIVHAVCPAWQGETVLTGAERPGKPGVLSPFCKSGGLPGRGYLYWLRQVRGTVPPEQHPSGKR